MSRAPAHHRRVPLALGAIFALAPCAEAQSYLQFDQVPIIYTQSPATFTALLNRGFSQPLRLVLLGDSQETSPGGAGSIYVPRLNYEFFRIYGSAPETPVNAGAVNTGGGEPWSDWLVRTAIGTPGAGPTRLPPNMIPPNLAPAAVSLLNGDNVNGNEVYGVLLMLQPGAEDTSPAGLLAGSQTYFDTSAGVYLDVYGATASSSGELTCRVSYARDHSPSFFVPPVEEITTSMGLSDTSQSFRRQRLGPFIVSPGRYLQVEIGGSEPDRLSDLVAANFVSAASPRGATVSSLSQGGYRTSDYINNHALGTQFIREYGPDALLIHYGANDAGGALSPEQFRSDMSTLIFHLRGNLGPDFPIFVFSETFRELDPGLSHDADQYAGVLYQLAQSDPYLCVVNSRRLTDEVGWNAQNFTRYLFDGVHYSAAGARLLARLEVNALAGAFLGQCSAPEVNPLPQTVQVCSGTQAVLSASSPDPTPVTYQWQFAPPGGIYTDLSDGPLPDAPHVAAHGAHTQILTLLDASPSVNRATLRCVINNSCATAVTTDATLVVYDVDDPFCLPRVCDPDVNQDGVADQTDVDYLINAIAGGGNPADANLDFNQDGAADQTDVDALINVIAGGDCP